MSKGGGQTQTTSNAPPQYIQDAQQANIRLGQGMASPFLAQTPIYSVAGFTPDQMMAFNMARNTAGNAYMQPNYGGAVGGLAGIMGNMAARLPQQMLNQAGNMGNVDMSRYMNPYREQVVDRTMSRLGEARDSSLNQARARVGDGFRNTRAALLDSQIIDGYQKQAADTSASLYDQGYQQAAQLAQADLNRRLQALQYGVSGAMSGMNSAMSGLNAAQGMGAQRQQQQLQALQMLLGTGGMQQQQAQTALDVPWSNLQRLMGLVGTDYGGTQTTKAPGPDRFGQLLGAAASLGGAYLLSDRRLKTEVERLGSTPAGLPTYSYRYLWDEPGTRREGVMAQEAQAMFPEAVADVGGFLAVDYGRIA